MLSRFKDFSAERVSGNSRRDSAAILPAILMVPVSFAIAFLVFKNIFTYELNHAYTADAPLYWAVGRGMLNGHMPYRDMYENKPLGVFLISALSFALTDDTIICNLFSCLAAMMITVLPAVFMLNTSMQADKDRDEIDGMRKTSAFLTVLLSGLLITVYSEVRSGGFQTEEIGAAFSVLFICLVMKLKTADTRKKRIILTVAASAAIIITVLLKEPFLLVSVFGALLFVDNIKDFFRNIVIPCAAGGAVLLLIFAVSGVLLPYFSIYISRMLETRFAGESSAFTRTLDILRITDDIKNFSPWLLYLIAIFIVLTLARGLCKKRTNGFYLFHALRVAAAVFVASFCVGMGGYYYNHHFIFAVPIYCAFVMYGGGLLFDWKPKKSSVRGAVIVLWVAVMLASFLCIGNKYAGDYTDKFETISAKANYVDELLDFYGEESYQFIGFNGEDTFFGLTKHSPKGPVFAQDADNFRTGDTWFAKSLVRQLNEVNIVIVKNYNSPALDAYIQNLLATEFTESPALRFERASSEMISYNIYYRTSVFG